MTEKIFLTADWRHLAMLNYEIDRTVLLPYVPPGTELDQWNGRIYASMVGFLFLETRVVGLKIPFHVNFEEVNLRFYVRRKDAGEWKRGVVFIKEIVPRYAIAAVARFFYGEKYAAMPMRNTISLPDQGSANVGKVEYGWQHRGNWNHLGVCTKGVSSSLIPGSEEEYITEHYWGYSSQRDGGCVEYRVEHPSWKVWQVSESWLECDVTAIYGPQFVDSLSAKPISAFLAEGSPVVVSKGRKL